MNKEFQREYARLNAEQKKAVDAIDGPVLVVAGPGTGKTQLLSMRVANILKQTDTLPGSILCLTFTDNAARNMRERLISIIGRPAYHVSIHTFHSFGSDIFSHFPDYFTRRQMLQQIDELGQYDLMREIFEDLPHSNPLSIKVGSDFIFLRDTLATIGWLKQNALSPVELHEIINADQKTMQALAQELADIFAPMASPKLLSRYRQFLNKIEKLSTPNKLFGFPDYATECASELRAAIEATDPSGRYAPAVTAWRNNWCIKSAEGRHVFKDSGQNMRKLHALANVYQTMNDTMAARGLYDFDDMIVEAVHTLEANQELRLNLQERYLYILVDEFQDTNKAQLRILQALGDNPVFEDRPNIMVVGDDDQAIYAFQGAEVSNLVAFSQMFASPKIITLSDSYRSSPEILQASQAVARQISNRLEAFLPSSKKRLVAKAKVKAPKLDLRIYASELAQYEAVAGLIKAYVKAGVEPSQIAVTAPRHRYLERLVPYLGNRGLPIAYERREDILQSPIIHQLLGMAELVISIADNRQEDVDFWLPQVLAYDFWGIDSPELVELSLKAHSRHKPWLEVGLKAKNQKLKAITGWFVSLAKKARLEPLEYMLDQFMGDEARSIDSEFEDLGLKTKKPKFVSPMRDFVFSPERYNNHTDLYLTLLGQLSTLRQRLRQWRPDRTLMINDLVEFAQLHQQAKIKIVDTNPHTQSTEAVQVMTAFKTKGLEFEVVFVINAQDEVWGPTARSRTSRISLPKNLPIAPAGDSDNDKLRLLFVAMTRSKSKLHITGYSHDLDNKTSPALSSIDPELTGLKPLVVDKPASVKAVEILQTDWSYRFRQVIADKPALLEPVLTDYKLSVTHLNNFIDLMNAGPQYFFTHNLLRFPEAPTVSAAYGDAVHKTFGWLQTELKTNGKLPSLKMTLDYFTDNLRRKHLRPADFKKMLQRGQENLRLYLAKRSGEFKANDYVERGFNNDGVMLGTARLSGKIDRLRIVSGRAEVTDYKTGKPAATWRGRDSFEQLKLHKYRQQLMFYKFLVEGSASFAGRVKVAGARLEFIEPNDRGKLVAALELSYSAEELARFEKLVKAVWKRIIALDFPAVEVYPKSLKGTRLFEQDLIEGRV